MAVEAEQATSSTQHIGIFRVFSWDESEAVLGENDHYLDTHTISDDG